MSDNEKWIREVHDATVRIHEILKTKSEYRTLVWDDLTRATVSEGGLRSIKKKVEVVEGNLKVLTVLAKEGSWTRVEMHCLRSYYKGQKRLLEAARETEANIREVLELMAKD